jgi:MOSC domain-containing protein YiiM
MFTVDGATYTRQDAEGTFRAVGPWWQQLTAGRDAAAAWPIARRLIDDMERRLGVEVAATDPIVALTRLGRLAQHDPDPEVLAVALAGLHEAAGALRAEGALASTAYGTVEQLNTSDGGVPKRPVAAVDVDGSGVVGDRQAVRRHHGRPWQALCIWSADVIDQLAAEGHPIAAGRAGENVTVRGLPWADVRAGVHLQMGEVRAEVSVFALPCVTNAQWFLHRDFERMHHDRGPVSRVYASVLRGGRIVTGDPVVLEP